MKNSEKIQNWDNLPESEKRAMGSHWVTNESNLQSWNKPFDLLSQLKKARILQSIEQFSKLKNHCVIS
jgi:hypothetical protein